MYAGGFDKEARMATLQLVPRICRDDEPQHLPITIPTPAKVRAEAAEIRKSWSPRERLRRAELARRLLLAQWITAGDDSSRRALLQLTPTFPPWR